MDLFGSIVALVTPFNSDESLDIPAWRRLVEWHLTEGTEAIVVGGTTGESPTLSTTELDTLIEIAAEGVKGKIPIIAGAGTNSTRSTMERAQQVARAGADVAMVVCPYYNKPTQGGLLSHFSKIADSCPIPLVLYNVPGRTAVDLQPATVAALCNHPNIIAIKEAGGKLERIAKLCSIVEGKIAVLSGDDDLALEAILLGARGVISVTANVAPGPMARMCRLALQGDESHARLIDNSLRALHERLFIEANPIPTKWALADLGRITNALRLPMTALSPNYEESVRAAITQAHRGAH